MTISDEALERLRHEVLITEEPESGFARDIITVCDELETTARIAATRLALLDEVRQVLRCPYGADIVQHARFIMASAHAPVQVLEAPAIL